MKRHTSTAARSVPGSSRRPDAQGWNRSGSATLRLVLTFAIALPFVIVAFHALLEMLLAAILVFFVSGSALQLLRRGKRA